jgi:hypothetical protein
MLKPSREMVASLLGVSHCCRASIKFALSICMHETTRERLNGFLLNLILESFTKIYQHIPILVK